MNTNWHNATKKEPCPICGKPDWCNISDDGNACICQRTPSGRPMKGGGWLHFLHERPMRDFAPRAPKMPERPRLDMGETMRGFRAEIEAYHDGSAIFDSLGECAKELHLSAHAIDLMRTGRSAHYMAWAFPMRDADGEVVGIRLRRYGSSDKFSVSGGKDGLFYNPDLQPTETLECGIKGRELVICEGATDCIAGIQIGIPCVGRSSCGTGAEMLRGLCARLRVSRVTIVTDNDAYKIRQNGDEWRPGIDGAIRLAEQIGRFCRIVTPPKKDLREWVMDGLTAETFWRVASLQPRLVKQEKESR